MLTRIQDVMWSTNFMDKYRVKPTGLTMDEYEVIGQQWHDAHQSRMVKHYVITIVLFLAGLWAVWEHSLFLSVLLLTLAANSNRQSADHILVCELLNQQRMLALLISGRTQSPTTRHDQSAPQTSSAEDAGT